MDGHPIWTLSPALETDLYHVDAAYIAWTTGFNGSATFDLFTRSAPFGGNFQLIAGIDPAIEMVERFRYSATDIEFLRSLGRYDDAFLAALGDLSFTGDIDGFSEGSIAFPNMPLLRVTGPFIEALLLESALLRAVGIGTLIATKAARMTLVAEGRTLADFSLRRAHDPYTATRSAYIGGFHSTSFVDAARRFGIPSTGTIPHALVQVFDDERAAFDAVARTFTDYTLLIDTYDPVHGAEHAVETALQARSSGHRLVAVRLDSGPLDEGSRRIRATLDAAGMSDVRILVSGDIDEFRIQRLMNAGAPIDGFGVGGNLGVGLGTAESGFTGGVIGAVYKLAWYEGNGRMKIAGGKSTLPGRKGVWRIGEWERDVIALDHETFAGEAMLQPLMRQGTRVTDPRPLADIRSAALANIATLPSELRQLTALSPYPVEQSDALRQLAAATTDGIRRDNA